MTYYSQFGQDEYLYQKYFINHPAGVFIDIGAHDGISGSNTYFFELLGWEGICFEPVPDIFQRLQLSRKCQLRNLALSNHIGIAKFKFIKGHSEMLSGLVNQYSQPHLDRIKREFDQYPQEEIILDVPTAAFNDEVPYLYIDILSIDVEGSEDIIIKSIDFDKYHISFLIVEFNEGSDHSLIKYIESKGYTIESSKGCDLIFKKS